MTNVSVTLSGLDADWAKACRNAVTRLNFLFKQNGIAVVLSAGGSKGPTITVSTDPGIKGDAVHGRTSAESDGANRLIQAKVGLPEKVTINTPQGVRKAGTGILEIIAAHEFVHALGQAEHSSHLMAQTFYKEPGDNAAGDKLKAGGVKLPPLLLAPDTVDTLKGIWS
ncbi:MAG: hypothetical protein IPH26_05185 [Sterolibacteriaceae bacterium]|uniref:Uncharacterized protein n=1 Tax=Candidatus Methylophosphatis roskildensis TaxID=2899263 RepID=A0A9D7DX03_9PROT|nr:hypothetical protein [Candidatus Methylophosphatis roskildensis]MBK7235162.1 hypothetical protein [Sterolibacteriaceae bacterium]